MKNISKKWCLVIVATITTFFGIGYSLLKGTKALDVDSIIYVSNYSQLSNAVNIVNGTTDTYKIVLQDNINLDSHLQIGNETGSVIPNVILDLGIYFLTSKEIDYSVENFGSYAVEYGLINYGNLEINSTTGGIRTGSTSEKLLTDIVMVNYKKMTINGGNYYDGATAGSAQVLINHGELVVNSGTFTKKKYGGVVFSNLEEDAIVTFNGGSFIFGNHANDYYSTPFQNKGRMVMNGGSINGGQSIAVNNLNDLEINGGEISSNVTAICNGKHTFSDYDTNLNLIINGGNFIINTIENSSSGTPTQTLIENSGNVKINDGNFVIKNNFDNIRITMFENYGNQVINNGVFIGETTYGTGYLHGVRNLGNTSTTLINDGVFKLKQEDLTYIGISKFFSQRTSFKEGIEYNIKKVDDYKVAQIDSGGNYFTSGDGSIENPYQIHNVKQLDAVRYFPDSNYILMKDLDLEFDTSNPSGQYYNSGLGWVPIGYQESNSDDLRFKGVFDGNYHTIRGLNINRPDEENVGLFAASTGTITNLAIIDSSITGNKFVGGIVGYSWGEISNVYVSNNVYGDTIVGGVAGHAEDIKNAYNLGNITGIKSVGGIAGQGRVISYCYNTGIVTGEQYVNSLVGYTYNFMYNNALSNYRLSLFAKDKVIFFDLDNMNVIVDEFQQNWDLENLWEIPNIDGVLRLPKLKGFKFEHINSINLVDSDKSFKVGDTIKYEILPKHNNVKFISNNSVISISENGLINTLNDGSAMLSLHSLYDGYYLNIPVLVKNGVLTLNAMSYEVTYDANGGTLDNNKFDVILNDTYGSLSIPVKEGYNFVGWYLDEELKNKITSETIAKTASDHTLYAKWELKLFSKNNNYVIGENVISGVSVGKSILEFKDDVDLSDAYVIEIYDSSGLKKEQGVIGTGYEMKIYLDDNLLYEYKIVVDGDVNGDGLLNDTDVSLVSSHLIKGNVIVGDEYLISVDIDKNGKIDINDIIKMKRYINNK